MARLDFNIHEHINCFFFTHCSQKISYGGTEGRYRMLRSCEAFRTLLVGSLSWDLNTGSVATTYILIMAVWLVSPLTVRVRTLVGHVHSAYGGQDSPYLPAVLKTLFSESYTRLTLLGSALLGQVYTATVRPKHLPNVLGGLGEP